MARIVRVESDAKRRLKESMRSIEASRARVGWFESAQYPSGVNVAYVAAIQEFGSPAKNIPPRLGMRSTVEARRNAWRAMAKRGASAVLNDGANGEHMMSLVAELARADFLRTIKAVTTPPLKEDTVKARASRLKNGEITQTLRKPLVDTGLLIQTLVAVTE